MALKRTRSKIRGKGEAKKRADYIDRMYNSFAVKDIPRTEFRRRLLAATDPKKVQDDLRVMRGLIRQKQTAKIKQREIDEAMKEKQ